ncbi:helix-turn-helix domain-containing protein, partial [Enterococcus italicus]
MTYTHLTPDELVMIEAYAKAHQSVTKTAQMLKRSRQTIYTVYAYLK